MTKIPYTYKVVAVGPHTMDVEYSNPDYGTIMVGVRIPLLNEDLESVIEAYSPVFHWYDRVQPRQSIQVGIEGTGSTQVAPEVIEDKEALIAAWRENIVINKVQAHHTLRVWNLYDQVVDFVNLVGDPLDLLFHDSNEWRRISPAVKSIFENITRSDGRKLTEQDIDAFFEEASVFRI